MNRTQRRNMAKMFIKGQVNPKIRLRYTTRLEEFKQLPLEDLEAMKNEKFSNTDKLALQDAIKFKTEETTTDESNGHNIADEAIKLPH